MEFKLGGNYLEKEIVKYAESHHNEEIFVFTNFVN